MRLFSELSLRYKLLIGLLPVFLIILGFLWYAYSLNSKIESSFARINSAFLELRLISRLEILDTKLAEAAKAFVLTEDPKWQIDYDTASTEFDSLFDQARRSANPEGNSILRQFQILNNRIKGTELLILSKTRDGARAEAIKLFDTVYSAEQQSASKILTDHLESAGQKVSNDIQSVVQKLNNSEKTIILSFFAFTTIIISLFILIFTLYILRPLTHLSETAEQIESGNLGARAQVFYRDEIGSLAKVFNSMTSNLSGQIQKFNRLFHEQEESKRLLIKRDEELTLANSKLLDLDKRKSEFISIAAHQLRTPLSGIKWTISTILEGELGTLTDDQKTYLQKTYDSNERIISLVEDMLYADRIESGKNPLVLEPVNITDIIDSVLLDLYSKIKSNNLKITFTKNPNIPKIKLDAEKIRAVCQNIIENAVRYTPIGGTINISIDLENDEVEVRVKDSGIGIPIQQQSYLFTKFFRAENALRSVPNGTGLGLFIAKNIIDKHHGRMWYESEENKGSTFAFALRV